MRMTSPTELFLTPTLDAAWAESLLQPDRSIGEDVLGSLDIPFVMADDEDAVEDEDEDDEDDEDDDDDDADDDEDEEDDEDDEDEDEETVDE